ncbi:MAG: hypothetical protein AB4426_13295 [Xenococcaceae cyanobacterium]
MTTQSIFDYATPFDIMVGVWNGLSTVYSPKGDYLSTYASFVAIYWEIPKVLLYFRQIETNLDEMLNNDTNKIALKNIDLENITIALKNISTVNFDFAIKGKFAKSKHASGRDATCTGVETKPGIYLFNPIFEDGTYYNNQYFTSPNERHIIGPYVKKGEIEPQTIVAQTFSRLSYNVPEKYRIDQCPHQETLT